MLGAQTEGEQIAPLFLWLFNRYALNTSEMTILHGGNVAQFRAFQADQHQTVKEPFLLNSFPN